MTIITRDGKVVLAWAGPCPGVEAELAKARRGEDGYAVIDGAAWADYLPGDDVADWDTTTGKRLVERPEPVPTEEETLQAELSTLLAKVDELDRKAIRAMRADRAGTATAEDRAYLEENERQAQEARDRIGEIQALLAGPQGIEDRPHEGSMEA